MKASKLAPSFLLAVLLAGSVSLHSAQNQVLGWNNLGMHCMDSDYSVFSILPPYNVIEAQLIVNGQLVTYSNGYTVTYEAVADPTGSINTTSVGKSNFSQYDLPLYGADLPPDVGLLGWAMPGTNNVPQAMVFQQTNQPAPGVFTPVNWYHAEGIPITTFDDAGNKNSYPLMRLIARNASQTPVATNDIVLPVSNEMDCRACHASGTDPTAEPAHGWSWSPNPERDYRLNILRLHDERQDPATYPAMLTAAGFNSQGLYESVVADNHPVLCAKCHLSEALPGTGIDGVPPLTESVHSFHAHVMDPVLNMTLDDSDNRAACYRCHPGSTTKCLRGAMGGAVAADGQLAMQCQSCHGSMSQVGSDTRVGWFMEPNCQGCHSGTATSNSGQIRYTTVFTDTNGTVRVPANTTFATQPNTPAAGLSLYRFSAGHGGLQCSACHGSTHAIFPATHENDNLRNERIQGHAGVMVECTACHTSTPNTTSGGPHGMHPVGQTWVSRHQSAAEHGGSAQCTPCHGSDLRGTVLSRMQADRTLSAFGTKNWWRGFQVGCYNCHRGPGSEHSNSNTPAVVSNTSANTSNDQPVAIPLAATDANGDTLTLRIVSQPAHGTVGLSNNVATYYPEPGFVGTEQFTFAAWDGSTDSNLGTGTVHVAQGAITLTSLALVPPTWPQDWPVPFGAVPTAANTTAPVTHDWDFGDGSAHGSGANVQHVYPLPGTYNWTVVSTVSDGASTMTATNQGTVTITGTMDVAFGSQGGNLEITWPVGAAQVVLEEASTLGGNSNWQPVSLPAVQANNRWGVTILPTEQSRFYRLRQAK